MSEAAEVIKLEIARREAEISTLQLALDVLTGNAPQKTAPEPKQLALPAPKGHSPRGRPLKDDGGGIFTVNGVDIELGARAFALATMINDAEDCAPVEQLDAIFGGVRNLTHQCVCVLNKKLKAAGAEIVHFKGEGYRLQNIEETAE